MDRYQFDSSVLASMEASPVPFAVYQLIDQRVVTLVISAGFCDLFGFTDRREAYYVMDNDMYRAAHPDDMARIADAAFQFISEGAEYDVVYRTRTKRSKDYIVLHSIGKRVEVEPGVFLGYTWYMIEGVYSTGDEAAGGEMAASFSQILREGSLVRKNRYDPLTGLPNMTYFFELADAEMKKKRESGEPFALLFLDLCGMKGFNSKYGFSEGDQLIRSFAHLLAEHFSNESCAHFGQDHFALFTGVDGLEDRLRALFAAGKGLNGGKTLPIRVGIYLPDGDCTEIGKACDRAKMACDVTRNALVSCFHYFDQNMLAVAEKRQYIVENLDRAIAGKWIQVYYQAIVRTISGRVCDEEALSRWVDPVSGVLSPADFIPALEEAKLIYKLDLYVVEQVLDKIRQQAAAGMYVVPQSVNLSRADFDSCDIVEEIRRRVDEAGVGRDKLTIEITESMVGSNFAFMKNQIERFRSLGFHVWMDDFGSGYSSLDVLQNIRFDLIKFDMRFMQQLGGGEEGRIILTELVKMAIGLGLETVCEGVETEEQVSFLREIGCSKLQGYYYTRPIPTATLMERKRQGKLIGFENPDETEYFATLGRINLYDMAVIASEDDASLRRFFDTLPMAIIEIKDTWAKYVRVNRSYRDFMARAFGITQISAPVDYSQMPDVPGAAFMNMVMQCAQDAKRAIVDEKISDKITVHSFIRQVAVNPVTGSVAIAVAVLAVTDERETGGTTYANIARALASDYVSLYYVDLKTDQFIEYSSDAVRENLAVERHGGDFFGTARRDAPQRVYKPDQEYLIQSFTKENVVRAMDAQGTFTLTYRLLMDGKPAYVHMKGVRMRNDSAHIIIGVSNVDDDMHRKEAMERLQSERSMLARISALSGGYICMYTVDPQTERYIEYSATETYSRFGLPKEGERFFARSREDSATTLYSEDVELFKSMFTRENVMREIEQNGLFVLRYRIMIDGEPRYVNLKAAMVEEQGEKKLIVGVNNIDAHVRLEQEYLKSHSVPPSPPKKKTAVSPEYSV